MRIYPILCRRAKLKNLVERAIVHLLNGDEEKAGALVSKFMLERARQIHESLRQGEDVDLAEDWDNEIKEEEYFDNDDVGDDTGEDDGDMSPLANGEGEDLAGDDFDDDGMAEDDLGDDMADDTLDVDDDDDMGDFGDDDGDLDLEGKVDELGDKLDSVVDKIDDWTAEFDRMMAELDAEQPDDDLGDDLDHDTDDTDGSLDGDDVTDTDTTDTDVDDVADDNPDLANRMEDDVADPDSELPPEEEVPESTDMDDDDLKDITESVLDELERVTVPSNPEGKEFNGKTVSVEKGSVIPGNRDTMNRSNGAKPVMTRGPTHKGFARETAPSTDRKAMSPNKKVRSGNVRDSYLNGLEKVDVPSGDRAALIKRCIKFAPIRLARR